MTVHLHLPGIVFCCGFHAGGGDYRDDLSGGGREAQGAPIALDHVQIGGRAAGAGRLVGIQLLNLCSSLARTSGDGGAGMTVRALEGDGTTRGAFNGDLPGLGIEGGAPFEGMLVAQGDGTWGGRFWKRAGSRKSVSTLSMSSTSGTTSISTSGIALAYFKDAFAVVGPIRVAAKGMGGVLAAVGLINFFIAITGTGTASFLRFAGGGRQGAGTAAGAGT